MPHYSVIETFAGEQMRPEVPTALHGRPTGMSMYHTRAQGTAAKADLQLAADPADFDLRPCRSSGATLEFRRKT